MIPHAMWAQVLLAGALLCTMSIVDTLSYGIETAGVLTRKLAISISLFNILTMFSRLSNLLSTPILGNFPDKVDEGTYTAAQVLVALRVDLLFVIAGVLIGAALTPSWIRLSSRGIALLEHKGGSLPRTLWYALGRIGRIRHHLAAPRFDQLAVNTDFRKLPYQFLIYNIFVTCFYSIGVMSTLLAASIDHHVAATSLALSGIVNGIATMLLLLIVDPPSAIVVDNCINGKRPVDHIKTLNVTLVLTRLLGTVLALVVLPWMAQYVLVAAHFVDRTFGAGKAHIVGKASCSSDGLDYVFKVVSRPDGALEMKLQVYNSSAQPHAVTYPTGAPYDFVLRHGDDVLWQYMRDQRATQAVVQLDFKPHEMYNFEYTLTAPQVAALPVDGPLTAEAVHSIFKPVRLSVSLDAPAVPGTKVGGQS